MATGMVRALWLVLATGLAIGSGQRVLAQVAAPTPKPPETVIKVSVKLVQVDATVTDEKGHAVRDLQAQDFEILQDGKPQVITNFSYVNPPVNTRPGARADIPSGNPNKVRFQDIHRTVALVVDDLGLSFESTVRTRMALLHYVDTELQPGDLAAVVCTGSGVGALQQFTTDRRLLRAAIDHIRFNPIGGGSQGAFAPLESHLTNFPDGVNLASGQGGRRPGTGPGGIGNGNGDEWRQTFVAGSLGAIRYIVEGLHELPGRKMMVLFSENTQVFFNGQNSERVREALRVLVDAANRSAVVIYAIDPGGLRTTALTAGDDTARTDPIALLGIASARSNQEFDSQEGMRELTQATGGLFLHGNNYIDEMLQHAMEDAAGYYLIGYRPDAATFDSKTGKPQFHSLKVKLLRPGYKVRSRSGFFGVEDGERPSNTGTPREQLLKAMVSPFSSGDVHVRLTALFNVDEKAGPVLNSMLYIDAHELQFVHQPDGKRKATFDAVAVTFDENGAAADSSERTFEVQAKDDEQYEKLLKTGVVFLVQHPAKKPGPYQMRVAVRDSGSGSIGSANEFIEVPDLHHGRLAVSSITLTTGAGLTEQGELASDSSGQVRAYTPAVRAFKPGEAVVYVYQVLNAHPGENKQGSVEAQVRLFRNGEPIFTGTPAAPVTAGSSTAARMVCGGAIQLGQKMTPGDYVLQIAVTDKLAKEKHGLVTQAVDFEVQ
jgi:VWFA-related protein